MLSSAVEGGYSEAQFSSIGLAMVFYLLGRHTCPMYCEPRRVIPGLQSRTVLAPLRAAPYVLSPITEDIV